MNRILKTCQNPPYFFVDDSLNNLKELDAHFHMRKYLTFSLAAWGYLGPEDVTGAHALEYPVYEQEDLIDLFEIVFK